MEEVGKAVPSDKKKGRAVLTTKRKSCVAQT